MARFRSFLDPSFWMWALIGAGLAFSMLSFAGFFVGIGCIVLLMLMARELRIRRSWLGLLVGVGALCVVIAYINREGPGKSCHTFGDGGVECAHGLPDPRKWLVVGVLLIGAGLLARLHSGAAKGETS